jgi:hypothetical protein
MRYSRDFMAEAATDMGGYIRQKRCVKYLSVGDKTYVFVPKRSV